MNQQVIFGFQDQWQKFHQRNKTFLSRLPNLQAAFELSFHRELAETEVIDRVLYMLGRECVEDFFEILLMAGNGYGIGALKLLRGLYERAVTLVYLSRHPDEVDSFYNYFLVWQHKFLGALRRAYGSDFLQNNEVVSEQEKLYEEVRGDYQITDCKKCGTKRLNHTWSKLDFVSMAHETGPLGKLIASAYYWPLRHAHPTAAGMAARVEELPSGAIGFNPDSQPKEADKAVGLAHTIILKVLETQQQHFKLEALREALQTCFKDCEEIRTKEKQRSANGPGA